MPEGDTLWLTAEGLRPRLLGRRLEAVGPSTFSALAGRTVRSVEAQGKHLLIGLDDGRVIHSHLGMKGSWHVYRPGERWRIPARLARIVLQTADAVAVLFRAQLIEVRPGREVRLAHLGPDILAPTFDPAEAARRARLLGEVELGVLLLDQRVCAGIGNIYKCESLWRRRLDPWARLTAIDDTELTALYSEAAALMRDSIAGRRWPRAVHARSGRPCPRCNGTVRTGSQGDPPRLTYFCPGCQTIPRPAGGPASLT